MKFEPAKILPMVAACAAIAQRSMKANAIAVQGKAELFGATDQESTLVSARFDVAQDWVLVPASKLLSALKSIGSAEADWELLPESVTITAKGVRYSLPIIPKGDFPSLDAIGAEDSESRKRYGVQAAPLIEAIETVAPCVATQSARYTMMGVCLELGQVVATDGRRLAVAKYPVEGVQAFSAVIPAKLGPILRGIFGDAEETMTLSIGTNMVHFFGSEAILSTRQIEGKYPDWSAIMPRIISHKVTTSTADLIEAIQRVGFMADRQEKRVNFTLSQGQLTLTAKTPIDGEAFASMDFSWDGEPMEMSLNAAYLLPLLKGIKGEAFTLGINSPGKPIVLQGEGFQGLLMPMS
jgi:DNA polymerase-3 subunit beta